MKREEWPHRNELRYTPLVGKFDPQGLLALRDWAVGALSGNDRVTNARWARAAALPVETWRTFLAIERCALEARSFLDRAPSGLPPEVAHLIEESAATELQRFLSAVGQIRRIARIASTTGIQVVVLKGGVAALDGHPVALDDLDLLVPTGDVDALSAALDCEGYASWGPDMPSTPPTRYEPSSVPVDLHRAIHRMGDPMALLSRAQPVGSLPGILRLSLVDHLWHLLIHTSHHHPDRRGRIRDLSLLARAVAECRPGMLNDITDRIAADPDPFPLEDQLAMARQIVRGEALEDRFRRLAWAKYDAAARLGWLVRGERTHLLRMHVIRSLCARRRLVDEIRDLGERKPGVVPLVRRSAAFALAGLVARGIRWRQRKISPITLRVIRSQETSQEC